MNQNRLNKIAQKLNVELDDENRAILKLKIRVKSNFLSPYYFDKPLISGEVADYLLNNKRILVWKNGITIKIISNEITKEEEKLYSRAIKEYFKDAQINGKRHQKFNYVISIIMFVIGILVFSLMFILDASFPNKLGLWKEVIDVIAWVFIWEAVDVAVIEKLEKSNETKIAKNITESKIIFEKEKIL